MDTVTMEDIEKIMDLNLSMNMSDASAKSRMQNLFVSFHGLLRRHGLAWLVESNPKVAVGYVLAAIKPWRLRNRLESDLELSKGHLKKDFKGFMRHAIAISEAFQMVDGGRRTDQGTPSSSKKTPNRQSNKGIAKARAGPSKDGKNATNYLCPNANFGSAKRTIASIGLTIVLRLL